jgi:CheY-specific phosphatase CheX
MTNSWDEPLQAATASTFEDLAFLMPTGAPDELQSAAPIAAAVYVDFRGPMRGRVAVHVTDDVMLALGANMLGDDIHPASESLHDALGEVANVIAGNVLPAIAGRAKVFDLAAPATTGAPAGGARASVRLGIEGGRAEVYLYVLDEVGDA